MRNIKFYFSNRSYNCTCLRSNLTSVRKIMYFYNKFMISIKQIRLTLIFYYRSSNIIENHLTEFFFVCKLPYFHKDFEEGFPSPYTISGVCIINGGCHLNDNMSLESSLIYILFMLIFGYFLSASLGCAALAFTLHPV